jgi:hypothetical protein
MGFDHFASSLSIAVYPRNSVWLEQVSRLGQLHKLNLSRKLFHPLFAQRYSRLLGYLLKVFLKIVTTLCATFYNARAHGYTRTRVRSRTGLSIFRNAIGDDRYSFMAGVA